MGPDIHVPFTIQECARMRSEVLRMTETLEQREGEAGSARQTVSRLVNELDDEKRTVEEQKIALEEYRKVRFRKYLEILTPLIITIIILASFPFSF